VRKKRIRRVQFCWGKGERNIEHTKGKQELGLKREGSGTFRGGDAKKDQGISTINLRERFTKGKGWGIDGRGQMEESQGKDRRMKTPATWAPLSR